MSSDIVVGGIIYRRNGFNEWCEVDPESDRLFVAPGESGCLDEIERLRSEVERLCAPNDALAETLLTWRKMISRVDRVAAEALAMLDEGALERALWQEARRER